MNAVFLGSKALGLRILRSLHDAESSVSWTLVHPDDSADGRSTLDEFRAFAEEAELELHVASSRAKARKMIEAARPDVAFVCGWYWLLDAATLESVPGGFYGIHNSLLPKYRGGAPLVWALINGEREVGSTVFRFSDGMDDGDVLLQVRVGVDDEDHIADVLERIADGLVRELPERWRSVLAGSVALSAQDHGQATYCGQRAPGDGAIDWSQPAKAVHDFVRAQTPPYPGAFTSAEGTKITLLRTTLDERVYHGTPGQILQRQADEVLVACGHGTALRVHEVAVEGVREPVEKALSSIKLRLS